MSGSLGSRFEVERERLRMSRPEIAALCGVTVEQIRRVEKDESKPGAEILGALARSGGDVHYVLVGARSGIDPQRLGFIAHAIEVAVEEQLQTTGSANPRVLGLIYNKVLGRGRSSDEDIALTKDEVANYLEILRAADIPESELAKRLLRDAAANPAPTVSPTTSIKFKGNNNQVAGGNIRVQKPER